MSRRGAAWLAFALALGAGATGAAAETGISYRVTVARKADALEIEATFPAGSGQSFGVDYGQEWFVSHVELLAPAGTVQSSPRPGAWTIPCVRGCRVRYRFALGQAADDIADVDRVGRQGGSIVAPPSTWLLRPSLPPSNAQPYRLRVTTPPGVSFLTGLAAAPDDASTYVGSLEGSFDAPYAVFGHFNVERVAIGGAALTVALATPALDADATRIRAWVDAAARALTAYYGRFPVAHALIAVVTQQEGVFGKEMGGGGGASVLLEIAPGANLDDPSSSWMATHEMVHLTVPNMAREHTWLTEGLATYVEPIARVQAGELPATSVWRDALHGMPRGLPEAGDRGLDHTPTWGRIYWGGALFCLMADVEIAKQTHGAKSLQDALRGALAAGQDTTVARTPEQFFAAADRALGAPILAKLYARWAGAPVPVDLAALWRALGIGESSAGVVLDERAPLAGLRRAVTTAR